MPRPSITPTRRQLRAPLTVSAWLLLASLLPACAASTQAPRVRIIPADSSEAHRALLTEAWTAQTAFETFRLQNLPRLFGPFSERQICREPVGRFCVEPGDGSGAWLYIPEPAVIAEERLKLIAALGDIAARIPGDDWVAGQRVRYAVEAGLWDEANQAALDCAGSDWWCLALAGYVLHRQGNAVGADYAFGQALSRMRATERQRWTDPDLILDGALADSARSLVGLDRLTFIYSYWKLADPFLSLPGNELLAEHLARRVEIQFQWAAGFLDGLPWAADLDEMVLRYGLPDSRIRALGADFDLLGFRYYLGPPYGVPDLLTHYTMPAADLLPPFDEMVPGRGEWNRPLSRPRAGYRVLAGDASVEWIPDLSHQTAVFRRGSAVAVVATFDLPAHGFAPDARVDAGLVMLPLDNPLLTPVTTRVEGFTGPGPLALIVEPRPALMSLEVSVPSEGAVGRVRRELSIQPFRVGSVGISDILLYEAAVQRPDSLVDAIAAALPSNRVRPGQEVGVYWEMYGLDPGREPSVSMSLRLISAETGVVQQIGRVLGVSPTQTTTEIRWEEETVRRPQLSRTLTLTIPDLPVGTHVLELSMEVEGSPPFVVRKEIVIGGRPSSRLPQTAVTRRPRLQRRVCGTVPSEFVVGNEGNLAAFQEAREAEAFRDYWMEAWRNPPVPVPDGFDCFEWVRNQPRYFGHGPEPG